VPGNPVDSSRRTGLLGTAGVLAGVLLVGLAIIGLGVTFVRPAGQDFDEARGVGWATVDRCDRLISDGLFRSADIGRQVRVGHLGERGHSMEVARQDAPERPWLRWLGVGVGLVGGLPVVLAGFLLSLSIRRR
jgi:hypothetical protein